MINEKDILEAVNTSLAEKGSRKFTQSVELIINFKGVDFAKTENRLNMDIILPKGRGKEVKIVAFADGTVAMDAKKAGADMIVGMADIPKLDKVQVKQMTKGWEFVAQPQLMIHVGKNFGQILGGRGKTPRPMVGNPASMFANIKNMIKLKNRGKNLPTIQCPIGSEKMSAEDISENANSVISALVGKFGEYSIRSAYVKLSMGKPCKIGKAAAAAEKKSE